MKVVENGAAFLDEHEPGWDEKIDLDALDLGSPCNCVLGQLYRVEHPRMRHRMWAFDRKAEELALGDTEQRRFGFIVWNYRASYDNLTAAWRDLIARRRARAS